MPQHIVAIGDIGVVDDMVHIGDEAMFEALVGELRSRGIQRVTGVSSAPAESASRYGIEAVSGIGWPADREARVERMGRVLRTAAGESGLLDADDPAHAVIAALRDSDGLAVAGGGNMSSLWPQHIFERATLGAIASALGKPHVVSGQTIGPDLDPDDAELVRGLLSSARLVGLREGSSVQLCHALGLPDVVQTVDDASYLETSEQNPGDYCLVSLASHVADYDRDAVVPAIAELLDGIVADTGLEIVFLAHFGSLLPDVSRGDSVMHDRVIAAMSAPARVVTPTDSPAAARLARGAGLVVSSRYHPVVFAVPAGVPAIGIPVDDYTTVKLTGALGNFGQDGVLPLGELLAGSGHDAASRVWAERDTIRENAARLSGEKRAASAAWWDRVASVFA